jgi:hypothetical protein
MSDPEPSDTVAPEVYTVTLTRDFVWPAHTTVEIEATDGWFPEVAAWLVERGLEDALPRPRVERSHPFARSKSGRSSASSRSRRRRCLSCVGGEKRRAARGGPP